MRSTFHLGRSLFNRGLPSRIRRSFNQDMPDVPRNKMSFCSRHKLLGKSPFCSRKTVYRPTLDIRIDDYSHHIWHFPRPDPPLHTFLTGAGEDLAPDGFDAKRRTHSRRRRSPGKPLITKEPVLRPTWFMSLLCD